MSEYCYNCGLPDAGGQAKFRLRNGNAFKHDSRRALRFCNEECALQTMFLQLETRSTHDTITRFLAGKPITFAEFKRRIPVDLKGRSDRPETTSEANDSIDHKMTKNAKLDLPHSDRNFARLPDAGGRPRKWANDAQRKRAERALARDALRL